MVIQSKWYFIATALLGMFVVVSIWRFHQSNSLPADVLSEGGLQTISPTDDINAKMRKMAEQAVIDAWSLNKVALNYSPESVENVEKILGIRQKWYVEKKFTDKDIRAEALILGAYIGEVIRRQYGGTWAEDDDVSGPGSYPLNWGKVRSYPYSWCYKRLTQGSEDNVWLKYRYFVSNDLSSDVNKKGH